MVGANRVIPLVQTTAEMISEMIEKPIVKEVFHNILFENSDLKIIQIQINNSNLYIGKEISELNWDKNHGVVALSLVDENMKNEFIYSSKIKHYRVKEGDKFVIVGYERDIKEFEKIVGDRCG
jgi:Trk K+ transport system NAD-binding subunit